MSIALLATDTTVICRVVKALYDAAPGYTYLSNFLSYKSVNGLDATVNALASAYSSQTNAELAATVCTNLGLTGTAYTAGVDYLTSQFNATTAANRGVVIKDAMNGLANLTGDATFGSAAEAFNSSIAMAEAYSTNSDNTSTDINTLQAADETSAIASTLQFSTTVGETKTGTGGNDAFTATTSNTGQTLDSGDIANGGLGNDSLTITAQGAAATVQLDSIETVSIRLLSAQSFDTLSWSGTNQVVVNGDSTSNNTLTITNADLDTEFKLEKYGTINVTYLESNASSTAYAAASGTYYQTSTNISTINTGSAGIVMLDLGGDNALRLEGSGTDITISGAGSSVLKVDAVSGIDATAFDGNLDITFSAASNVDVSTGAGNDVLRFGTTFNGLDSVDGGDGTDTLRAAIAGSVSVAGIANVESAVFNATGNSVTMSMSGASFSTITFADATASVDLNLRDNIADGTTVKFTGNASLGEVQLDYASGAASVVQFNGVSGDISLVSSLSITDAVSVALSVESASGDVTMSAITLDSDVRTVDISLASGSLTLGNAAAFNLGGATTVSVTQSGSGTASIGGAVTGGSALSTLTLTNAGLGETALRLGSAADVIELATGETTVNINVTGSGSVVGGAFLQDKGSGMNAFTLNLNVGDNGAYGANDEGLNFTGSAGTFTLSETTIGASASVYISSIAAGASGSVSDITVNVGTTGLFKVWKLDADVIGDITIDAAAAGSAYITDGSAGIVGDITLTGSGVKTILLDTTSGMGNIDISGGSATLTVSSTTGGIGNVNITGSGTVFTNTAGDVGTVTVAGSGAVSVDVGSANNVGNVDTTGHGGSVTIDLSSAVAAVTVNLAASGTDKVYVGEGGDTVYMASGSGVDKVVFTTTSTETVSIYNFDLASATDQLVFTTAGFDIGLLASAATAVAALQDGGAATGVVLVSGDNASVTTPGVLSGGTQIVILRSGTYDSVTDMLSAISSAGPMTLAVGTAVTAGLDVIVAWADQNGDTHVTLVNTTAAGVGALFSAVGLISAANTNDLAILYGVNISTYTSSFADKFQFE
ncbi:hypothetical protein GH816_03070 [Betaproteobacteria bacterium LSUCC0115]|nr:hypothetical protein [Burkholderiales bacterium LSUCC0115]